MNPDEQITFLAELQERVRGLLPDERPKLSRPEAGAEFLHVNVVIQGGRYIFGWNVPYAGIDDPTALADSLEAAIAKVGLAGIVYVYRTDQQPVTPEEGSNVIPPSPLVPKSPEDAPAEVEAEIPTEIETETPRPAGDQNPSPDAAPTATSDESGAPDYESWTKDVLMDEINVRGIGLKEGAGSGSGGNWLKDDLIRLLRQDDAVFSTEKPSDG